MAKIGFCACESSATGIRRCAGVLQVRACAGHWTKGISRSRIQSVGKSGRFANELIQAYHNIDFCADRAKATKEVAWQTGQGG